jgi:hypothetical protein
MNILKKIFTLIIKLMVYPFYSYTENKTFEYYVNIRIFNLMI